MATRTVLTGIKPSGRPHLGNLLGAIRPALELARDPSLRALYFIADYHALTTQRDPRAYAELTRDVAATWIAFGLDPERVVIYRQSDIPEVFELSWILACFTPKGWMNKAHAYKACVQDNEEKGVADVDAGVDMGLYTYPVLMAADILLFDSDVVPVGKDQKQHVEIARDIAQRINHAYGRDLLVLPEPAIREDTATVVGLDGRKMSKSYDNTIPLMMPPKQLKKLCNRIVTDSSPPEAPKDPGTSSVFELYKQFASASEIEAMAARYRAGIGWGEAKGALFEVLEREVAGPRARYEELMADPGELDRILAEGARRARELARPVLERVRAGVGIAPPA
jgi:tryptophanyl-tRNA synthetase